MELLAKNPNMNQHTPPDMDDVHEIISLLLDKNSLYAGLTPSRNTLRGDKHRSGHKKESRRSKTYDTSEEEDDSSSEEEHHSQKRSRKPMSSDSSESEGNSSDSNSDSESDDTRRTRHSSSHKKKEKSTWRESYHHKARDQDEKPVRMKKEPKSAKDDMAKLSEKFEELQLMFADNPNMQGNEIPRSLDTTGEPTNRHLAKLVEQLSMDVRGTRNDTLLLLDQKRLENSSANARSRACFFCRLANAHQWGTTNCPEAQAMGKEGFCVFRDGRIEMADNSNFPRVAPGENMAAAIRATARSKRSPLTGANRVPIGPTQVSYAHVIDSCDLDSDGYDTEIDHVGSAPAMWQHVFTADRSQVNKTSARFNLINKEKHVHWKNNPREVRPNPNLSPYVDVPYPPEKLEKVPEPKGNMYSPPNSTSTSRIPSKILKCLPENEMIDIDRNDPSRELKKVPPAVILKDQPNIKKSDFTIQADNPITPNNGPTKILHRNPPKAKYMTSMRERHNADDIYNRVLDTTVSLPLSEFLAACPGVEKAIASETRLHSVPVTQVTARELDEEVMEAYVEAFQDTNHQEVDPYFEEDITVNASRAGAREDEPWDPNQRPLPPKKAVESTGSCKISIGGYEVTAMVDSGAEMNMVTPRLAERLRDEFAEDESGKRIRMKNVSGTITYLKGRFNDIPTVIGGMLLNETYFVGEAWNSHFEAILGQSFLSNNGCELRWDKEEPNYDILRLYPGGDKDRDPISVRLQKNTEHRMRGNAARVSVAEIFDTEDDWEEPAEDPNSQIASQDFTIDYQSESDEGTPALDGVHHWIGPRQDADFPSPESNYFTDHEGDTTSTSFVNLESEAEVDQKGTEPNPEPQILPGLAETAYLEEAFNNAVNSCMEIVKPGIEPINISDARSTYDEQAFHMTYHLPLGNKALNIRDGSHNVQINGKTFRALLEPSAHFNIVTKDAFQDMELEVTRMEREDSGGSRIGTPEAYCPAMPIVLRPGPPLPGIFLVTDCQIPDGYDVILGKPWMMGIGLLYKDCIFDDSMNIITADPRWSPSWSAWIDQHMGAKSPFRKPP